MFEDMIPEDKLVLEVSQLLDMALDTPYYELCCGLLALFMTKEDRDKAIALLFEKELFNPLGKLLSVESPKRVAEELLSRKGRCSYSTLINTFASYLDVVDRTSLTDDDKLIIWETARELLADCAISNYALAYDAVRLLQLLRDFAPTETDIVSIMYGIADSANCCSGDSKIALNALSNFAHNCPDLAVKYIDDLCELLHGTDKAEFIVTVAETRPGCRAVIDKFISAIEDVIGNRELICNSDVRCKTWHLVERVCRISTGNAKQLWPTIIKMLHAFCEFAPSYLSVALFDVVTPVTLEHVYDFIGIIKRGLYEFHVMATKERQHESD